MSPARSRSAAGLRWFLAILVALWSAVALAHEMTMAEMEVREGPKGQFVWGWGQGASSRPIAADLTPVWPDGCVGGEQTVRCPPAGMIGKFTVEGVGKRYSAALVRITWLDGQARVYTITSSQPSVQLYGAVDDRRGRREVVAAYTLLGIEHILTGIDHLLFVISLLFLVGFNRRLVATITAFTVAHSLTLASSAVGLLTLRSAPVEASIALSILLVAGEALHARQTLARRFPAIVAFAFGLVHGLGFAGALKEIGLPASHLPMALFTFNVGVEIGQLFAVGVAYGLYRVLRQRSWAGSLRAPVLYGIGVTAAYWSWQRLANIFLF